MKTRIQKSVAAAAVLIAGVASAAAQDVNVLKLYTALEVQFPTEIGKLYTLQGSSDLTNWVDIGQPLYGHGRVVDQFFSTKTISNINYSIYRLKVDAGPTNGYAPWKMHGRWMVMGNDATTNVVQFDDQSHGRNALGHGAEAFEYEYSRTGESEAEIERHYGNEREDRVTLSYTGAAEGTWVREEFRHGGLERRQMGRFHSSTNDPGTTPPPIVVPAPQPPAPPVALTGLKLQVRAGELPVELKFLTATNGTEEAGESRHGAHLPEVPFTYEYSVLSSNTASLNINFPTNSFDGDRNEYDLTFTDGASGTFTRRVIRGGEVTATDTGVFGPDHAEVEAGDDHGGHGTEVGDDHGTGVEPGDDNGTGIEPGDDNGTGLEPGDDNGTTVEPGDDNGTGGTSGRDDTTGGHNGGGGEDTASHG
jgi:hypothetical protein